MKHFKNSINSTLIILLFFSQSITAQVKTETPSVILPSDIKMAFSATMPSPKDSWAYTRTEITNGKTWVDRFDPLHKQKWQLISVNGAKPTEKQKNARNKKFTERESDDDYFGKNDFSTLAEPDSWEKIEETESLLIYKFNPLPEDEEDKKIMPFLKGKLYIKKTDHTITKIELRNIKAFKPAPIAKIKSFNMQIELQQLADGSVVPSSIANEVSGRALFKRFEEKSKISYSEIEARSEFSNKLNEED